MFLGLFLSNGYWFNLKELSWKRLAPPPPTAESATESHSLFSFGGKPTLFGSAQCNGNAERRRCPLTKVIQFDPTENEWKTLGQMLQQRTLHEVIEVPISFCELLQ